MIPKTKPVIIGKRIASSFLNNFWDWFLVLIIISLPFYFWRFPFFLGGTLSLLDYELALFILIFGFWFLKRKPQGLKLVGIDDQKNKRLIGLGIFLILEGLLASYWLNLDSGTTGWQDGLGILKSFYFLPIFLGIAVWVLIRAQKINLTRLLWAYYAISAWLALLGGIFLWEGRLTYDSRLALWNDSPNQLAFFLGPGLIIGVTLWRKIFQKDGFYGERFWLTTGTLTILGWAIWKTGSAGTLWGLAVAFLFLFWPKRFWEIRKKFFGPAWIILTLILVGNLFLIEQELKMADYSPFLNRSSFDSRLVIYQSATKIIAEQPIIGIGAGHFQEEYLAWQEYFPPYPQWAVPHPHNMFLNFWLEGGLGACLGFALLVWLLMMNLNQKRTAAKNLSVAILLFFLASGLFDVPFWKNDLAVVFWLFGALSFLPTKKEPGAAFKK